MKFQPIFIFLAIIVVDFSSGINRLSEDDNQKRLRTCGTKKYDKESNEVISWGRGGKKGDVESTATLISKQHILTSSKLVLTHYDQHTQKTMWLHDGSKFDGKSLCINISEKPVLNEVPREALKYLNFEWISRGCQDGLCGKKISRAYILCSIESWRYFCGGFFLPMVVEIKSSLFGFVTFCLPTENDSWLSGEVHKHYQYNISTGEVYTSNIKMKQWYTNELAKTDPYNEQGDSGGPLIAGDKIRKLTLIGIGVFGGYLDGTEADKAWFYRAKWFTLGFCDWFGICHKGQVANIPSTPKEPEPEPTAEPTAEPAATEKPTTEELTTEKPTTEEPETVEIPTNEPPTEDPTAEKPTIPEEPESTTSPVKPKPSEPEESTPPEPETMEPIKTIDLDEEYKEFKEKENNEEEDWDEWGNDFYMSADFFESSGRRTELFVGFLMVMMVVWRMVLG